MCIENLLYKHNLSTYHLDRSIRLCSDRHTLGFSEGCCRCLYRDYHILYTPCWKGMFLLFNTPEKKVQLRNSDSDINSINQSKLEYIKIKIAVLTTQLCGLPLLRIPTCMSALTGVLRYGWTQTWGTAVTVAHVLHTGIDEGVGINQVLTANKCWSWQDVLTKVCLWVRVRHVIKLYLDILYKIVWSKFIFKYLIYTSLCGWVFFTVFSRTIDFRGLTIRFKTDDLLGVYRKTKGFSKRENRFYIFCYKSYYFVITFF